MNKAVSFASALIAFGCTAAFAADLPVRGDNKDLIYSAPAYNWTGVYVGANIGGGWGNNNTGLVTGVGGPTLTRGQDTTSFVGGGEIGADYMVAPNWLIGIEALIEGGRFHVHYADGVGESIDLKNGWIGAVAGRLGYTWGPSLLYGKGGVAFRNNPTTAIASAFAPISTFTSVQNTTGYTYGLGFEYMLARAWSAKIEYNHYDFGNATFTVADPNAIFLPGPFAIKSSVSTVTVGANYHFN